MTETAPAEIPGVPQEKRQRLSTVAVIAAGLSTLLPGAGAILGKAPPLLYSNGILCAAAGAAFVFHAFRHPNAIPRQKAVRTIAWSFIPAIFLFAIYSSVLDYYTVDVQLPVLDEAGEQTVDDEGKIVVYDKRQQIGFGVEPWTIKAEVNERIEAQGLQRNAKYLVDNIEYAAGNPEVIWRNWTITAAGMLLVVLYVGSWFLWIRGWCTVIRME